MKIIIALILTSSVVFSQNDSLYKFTLPQIYLTHSEKGKLVTYAFEEKKNHIILTPSCITADTNRYNYKIDLNDLRSVSIRNGFSTLSGAKYGGFIGGGIGFLYGVMGAMVFKAKPVEIAVVVPGFILTGFLGGALIGGLLGSFDPHYDSYNLFNEDNRNKSEKLRKILFKHDLNNGMTR